MSLHKNLVGINLSFFVAPEKCHNINFFVGTNIFALSSSTLSRHSYLSGDIHSGVVSTFVAIIFLFIMTEFVKVACCYFHDRLFLCRDIVLLSFIAETKLSVMTNSEYVAC